MPGLLSSELSFTNLPAIAFRPDASTVAWTASGGALTASTSATFTASLTPSVNDMFRALDVYLDAGGQSGAITLARYHPLAPRT